MASPRTSWAWVPTLYFAEGLPYVLVVTVSAIMFKQLGISNADVALYTSWLYLPWVIKPFWSPFVDLIKTKRWWLLLTQLILGAGLAGVALTLNTTNFFRWSLAIMWLLAFSSATHDISIDGFYMLGLDEGEQSLFVGIRNTAYRIAMIAGQGGLLILVGLFEKQFGSAVRAWSLGFLVAGGLIILIVCFEKALEAYCDVFFARFQQQGRLDVAAKASTYRIVLPMVICLACLIVTHNMLLSMAVWLVLTVLAMLTSFILVAPEFGRIEITTIRMNILSIRGGMRLVVGMRIIIGQEIRMKVALRRLVTIMEIRLRLALTQ